MGMGKIELIEMQLEEFKPLRLFRETKTSYILITYKKYEISNYGRLRKKGSNKFLKFRMDKDGYLQIELKISGERKYFKIHRLVASTFIENTDLLPTVDHINRNKTDNYVENLRWASYSLQNVNSTKRKIKKTKYYSKYKGVSKHRNKWKSSIKINGVNTYLGLFETENDAARAYNTKVIELYGDDAVLNEIPNNDERIKWKNVHKNKKSKKFIEEHFEQGYAFMD